MKYCEVQGDLFLCQAQAIAHCVSSDLAMSKGIALEFRNRFGRINELQQQRGVVRVLRHEAFYTHIFYLVTKEKYWQKPTYESLHASLLELRRYIVTENIGSLAIPLLGCGLDRLDWSTVRVMIQNVFSEVDVEITVCYR